MADASSRSTRIPPLVGRLLAPFQRFLATTAAGGIVLLATTVIALAWANSPWAASYFHFWEHPIAIGTPSYGVKFPMHLVVNDGLMAIFFLLVGLEIKREFLTGALATRQSATLPVAAAFGGMVVPAVIYAMFNHDGAGARGWGIPMATDIAFALGVLALLGNRIPTALRVFLAALAIADDLGAVLVIAVFYTSTLHFASLVGMGVALLVLFALNAMDAKQTWAYLIVGIVLWCFTLASGIHATVAGVLLALFVPARVHYWAIGTPEPAPLERIEHALRNVVPFVIVPLFALANAGVALDRSAMASIANPISLGVALGLFFGKPIGIMLASVIAIRSGAAQLSTGVTWRHLHGAAWLGGIGFTMSLFVAGLAFESAAELNIAKVAVFGASTCAGIVGYLLLRNLRVSTPV